MATTPASGNEIKSIMRCNGQVGWLAKESRPDLACQLSFNQQMLPTPTLGDVCLSSDGRKSYIRNNIESK